MAILRGLMDTDGTIDNRGNHAYLATSSRQLACNFKELVLSLGGKCSISVKKEI